MKSVETLNQLIKYLIILIESGLGVRILYLSFKAIFSDDTSEAVSGIKHAVAFGVGAVLTWAIATTVMGYFR